MKTENTEQRRNHRTQWLRDHPATHRWLRQQKHANLRLCALHPRARDMVEDLKRQGIYSAMTVATDICSVMRRAAAAVDPDAMSPNELAYLEICEILERKGVSAPAVVAWLNVHPGQGVT